MAIDLPLVYTVRTRANARRQAPSPPAETSSVTTKGPAIARSPRAAGTRKARLIRARTKLAPKEIAERPKSAASKREVASVHDVRRSNKTKRKPVAKTRSPLVFAKPQPLPSESTSDDEELLKIIAAEVGLARAIDVLQAERSRVRAMFPAGA